MNVLGSVTRLKCASSIVNNFVQGTRGYAAFKKIPVEWVRPTEKPCTSKEVSGDGGLNYNILPTSYITDFEDIASKLNDEPDFVKKQFAVNFQRRHELVKVLKERARSKVARHEFDERSMEAKIAKMTAEIHQLQDHQEKFPTNRKSKVILKECIEKRKKWLKILRVNDYQRFEFLLERLNLFYHPFPEENPRLTRKSCTKKLLQKHLDEVVQGKLDEYRTELQARQKDFFKEKVETLEFIRREEIACGVTPTITLEDIEAAKQKAASLQQ